jgi:hypothetical protein
MKQVLFIGTVIFLTAVWISAGNAVEGETYVKGKPGAEISKIEAMRALLTSDNKAEVYKCVLVELSKKGTVKNK